MVRQKSTDYGLLLFSLVLYSAIGFSFHRYETGKLMAAFSALFGTYMYIVFRSDDDSIGFWFYTSILFRAVLLFNLPNLSDDFYRFIWDGRLWASGYHPFAEVPSFYVSHSADIPGIDESLFQKLNSPEYFTIYPPLAQLIFWLAVKISPTSIYGSVLVMKVVVFMAEIGSLKIMQRLLSGFGLPAKRILIYALNPLIILELVGNVHLEAVLIFFLLLSVLLLFDKKVSTAAVAFSGAVCVKLIPLIFLPSLISHLGWKKALRFYLIAATACVILFIPFWDMEVVYGFQDSIAYYFKKFEFNASIYYLVRGFGYWQYGYDVIQTVGWKLGLISFTAILLLSKVSLSGSPGLLAVSGWRVDRSLLVRFLLVLLAYYLFTTTLHPWYIAPLLAISIFTEFRFPILWSGMIFLTYSGYSEHGFHENLVIVFVEYVSVLGYFTYELLWKRKYLPLLS